MANGELNSQKAKVIYNPAQIPETLPNGKGKKEHLTFIMVCRLTPIKNIPATLKAFATLKPDYHQRYKLMIIGEGEQRDLLEKMVGELGLGKVVSFLGYQSNVSDFLYGVDVFMIPSISEGSSVALTEAMLHGLPSIVTKVGGASEIIGTSESAVMVNPNNITEISEAIQYFIDLPQSELAKMGSRAKEFAGINFSPQKYAEDLLSLYKNPF
jgi:glycosyltransferase involved in cell wall biosynthesis